MPLPSVKHNAVSAVVLQASGLAWRKKKKNANHFFKNFLAWLSSTCVIGIFNVPCAGRIKEIAL